MSRLHVPSCVKRNAWISVLTPPLLPSSRPLLLPLPPSYLLLQLVLSRLVLVQLGQLVLAPLLVVQQLLAVLLRLASPQQAFLHLHLCTMFK